MRKSGPTQKGSGEEQRPHNKPPQAAAPGSVRRGSFISSPMTEASSRPTKPKQITPKELSTKRGLGGTLKSAAVMPEPKRDQITIPNPTSTAAAIKVPRAPTLLIHLPTPRPRMFNRVSSASSARETEAAKSLLSGSPWGPGPS